jgi:hypothetical protein
MESSMHRVLGLVSHGIVWAIGLFGGRMLFDHSGTGVFVGDPPSPVPASHAQVAAAWRDQSLAKARAERWRIDHYRDWEKLPVPELLKRHRREVAEQRAEYQQRLDAIVTASSQYRDLTDPAAAIRAEAGKQGTEGADAAFAIFHAWREP